MKNKRAYTLIEIVVVLAIISILAALLFAALGRVRENGKQATCQSNLHQIYLALSQYVSDNDSHFPNHMGLKSGLMLYTKNEQVFFCPSAPKPIPDDIVNTGSDYGYAIGWLNSLSFAPSTNGLPTPRLSGLNEATTVDVSKIPITWDIAYTGDSREVPLPGGAACGWTEIDGTPTISYKWATVHNGGFNILFYDGHIKWMSPEQASEWLCNTGQYAQPPFRAGGPHISFPAGGPPIALR